MRDGIYAFYEHDPKSEEHQFIKAAEFEVHGGSIRYLWGDIRALKNIVPEGATSQEIDQRVISINRNGYALIEPIQVSTQHDWKKGYESTKKPDPKTIFSHRPGHEDIVDMLKQHLLNEGILHYHPKRGFLYDEKWSSWPKISKAEETGPINLIHYSRVPNLKTLDPAHMGTGTGGAEMRHGIPEVKTVYYYRKGSKPEDIVKQGAKALYHVELGPQHKLYDLGTDPEDHVKMAMRANQGAWDRDKILGHIRNQGYSGFYNSESALPHAVALFIPHDVKHEEML